MDDEYCDQGTQPDVPVKPLAPGVDRPPQGQAKSTPKQRLILLEALNDPAFSPVPVEE